MFSVLPLTSPVLHAHHLYIFLNRLQPPQLRFPYLPSAFWFKKMLTFRKYLFLKVRAKANDLLILFSETLTVIVPLDKCGWSITDSYLNKQR
jgi:hypothetical protein